MMRRRSWIVSLALFVLASPALAVPSLSIDSGQWYLLSYPADTEGRTVRRLFAGSLRAADYGERWQIFTYNGVRGEYENPGLDGELAPGKGFWVVQATGETVEIGTTELPFMTGDAAARGCQVAQGCVTARLDASAGGAGWNMAGHPFESAVRADEIRVFTRASGTPCRGAGCSLDGADAVVGDILWAFDPSSERYRDVSRSTIKPWDGFWIPVQQGALSSRPELVFPDPFCS